MIFSRAGELVRSRQRSPNVFRRTSLLVRLILDCLVALSIAINSHYGESDRKTDGKRNLNNEAKTHLEMKNFEKYK